MWGAAAAIVFSAAAMEAPAGLAIPGSTVRLGAGAYRGPWRVAARVHVIARGATVTAAAGTVVTVAGDGVTIEGLAIHAPPGGTGIEASDARRLTLAGVEVGGGRRGVCLVRTGLSFHGGRVSGASEYGLWARDATVDLADLWLSARSAAVYVAGGEARAGACDFSGGEYGALAFRARIEISASRFHGLFRAGVAATRSRCRLDHDRFEGPFTDAAVSAIGAPAVELRGCRVTSAGAVGVKLVNSTATLSGDAIEGARSDAAGREGDGLYAFDSQVSSAGDRLIGEGGTGVTILGGKATVRGCRIERTGQEAAYVGEKGTLVLIGCAISQAPAGPMAGPGATLRAERCKLDRVGHPDAGLPPGPR